MTSSSSSKSLQELEREQPVAGPSSAQDFSASQKGKARLRVWRACDVCRKRKIRCDGQEPCGFCSTNKKDCAFTTTQDHASLSRLAANDTNLRLERLESAMERFSSSGAGSGFDSGSSVLGPKRMDRLGRLVPIIEEICSWWMENKGGGEGLEMLEEGSNRSERRAGVGETGSSRSATGNGLENGRRGDSSARQHQRYDTEIGEIDGNEYNNNQRDLAVRGQGHGDLSELYAKSGEHSLLLVQELSYHEPDEREGEEADAEGEADVGEELGGTWANRLAGRFVKDSMGNSRYLGGASTFVLAEAVDSLRSADINQSSSSTTPHVQSSLHTHSYPETSSSSTPQHDRPSIDHLYFRPNAVYRPLRLLPQVEFVDYPPLELSDALVHMYFSKIHHTFPIIDKPSFLAKYRTTMDSLRKGQPSDDSTFLCVLFAVYASAASLTKKRFLERPEFGVTSPHEYIGLEFYERALYLYWAGFRMMTIDHVTCMALLSACLAGWNTLAQSWVLAGQAVRGAQDIGLHRSPRKQAMSPSAKEHRRRVWWCVYGLDKILSVSLGRPSGTHDDDCDVEMPAEDLSVDSATVRIQPATTVDNPMPGFVALLRIYIIAGRIERTAHGIAFLEAFDNSAHEPKVRETVASLDAMLGDWNDSLPDSVRFAANDPGKPRLFSLCLLGHFNLYACQLNLHRPFMPDSKASLNEHTFNSLHKCISAAKGCIRIGSLVKTLLPSSHHCQFCVQYLTISGIILLRCIVYLQDAAQIAQFLNDAARCRQLLRDLEDTWEGSRRCGELLEDLLAVSRTRTATEMGTGVSVQGNTSNSIVQADNTSEVVLDPTERGLKRSIDHVLNPQANPGSAKVVRQTYRELGTGKAAVGLTTHQSKPNSSLNPFSVQSAENLPTSPFVAYATPAAPTMEVDSGQGHLWDEGTLDFAQLANAAPFDLSDDIGAFFEQLQNPPMAGAELGLDSGAAQWSFGFDDVMDT